MGKSFVTKVTRHPFVKKYWLLLIALVVFCLLFYWYILRDLPSPVRLGNTNLPQSSQIYDRNGVLLYTIYSGKNQTFIPLATIPKTVQEATIAIEDKDFYNHGALDFRGIARAFVSTVFHRETQGGSTITQQLIKNTLLSPEQTITRKIREAILSFVTELLYPKTRILELYLNEIPYGGTTYGIEAAAQTYFGKHAAQLDLAQSALLAGLPEAPTVYSPFGSHPELAKERQLLVLTAMEQQGYITKAQETAAEKEPLKYQQVANQIQAPHFSLYIKDLLTQEYGEQMVEQGGLKVITSLDINIQNMAQAAVANNVQALTGVHVTNGAALVTQPGTGEILAMVGSRDYFDTTHTDGNVNVTLMLRQPGSSIKPVNYVLGLISGYTAATPFVDEAVCFPDASGQPPYCPMNYDGKFHGVQQMRYALGNSLNIPAVKMLKANGVANMITLAKAMGITTFGSADRYGLSLTLGGGEVTMLDMATAYGVFANGGYRIDLHPILKVTDKNGKVLQSYTPPISPIFGTRVFSPAAAFIISSILSDNNARLIDFGPSSQLVIPKHTVAAKTGTTNDFRDNWTFGYTPSYLVAAWVGNNDNTPMGNLASGITGAAPIWHDIMNSLLQGKPDQPFVPPAGVIQKAICNTSGLLPEPDGTPNRCGTRFEYFISGTEPKQVESYQNVAIDNTTQDLAAPGQTTNISTKSELVVTDPTGTKFCVTCPHPELSPTPTPTP